MLHVYLLISTLIIIGVFVPGLYYGYVIAHIAMDEVVVKTLSSYSNVWLRLILISMLHSRRVNIKVWDEVPLIDWTSSFTSIRSVVSELCELKKSFIY